MGCSECGNKGGCSVRKGEERELLARLLPALYPDRRWGEPDDHARHRHGVPEREGRRLARQAAAALEAPAYFRAGADDEWCDFIYVLCVGRPPALVELRDHEFLDVPDGDHIRERYLRVALSSMARIGAVQEIAFELDREADLYVVRERPRDGIFDPILLRRTQSLVELLVANDVTYLDFGLLAKPVSRYAEGFADGDYEERYGQSAATLNYLFFPQPATAVATSFIPASPRVRA
jgi:hypothetical protein